MLTLKVQESLWACWIPRSVICMPLICYYYFTNNYYNILYASINFLQVRAMLPTKKSLFVKEVKMSVFKCLDIYNSLAILPTCAIPRAYVFCKRVTERSETMISVAWNFPVMWDRTTTQPGTQGLMAETPLQGAGVHPTSSQTGTSRHLQLRSVERSTAHRAGFLCQSPSEMSFQMRCPFKGLAPPCSAHRGTWWRLPSKQLNDLRHQQGLR